MLAQRSDDRAFRPLIRKGLKAGIRDTDGKILDPPEQLGKFGLEGVPEKTHVLRFSRFHPSRKRRFTFLGVELYGFPARPGERRVKQRTSRKNLQGEGHYSSYGLRGNSESLYRFYKWAKQDAFKWLNRRGGKGKNFTWEALERALERLGIALPKITEVKRQHVVYA
jgi:RNA-directed DNA polymerase